MVLERPELQFVALFPHAGFDEVHVISYLYRVVSGNDRRNEDRHRNVQPQLVQFLDPKEALIEKRLMENELKRVYEFASLAENRSGILRVLRPLMEKYQIDYGVKE